MLNYKRIKQLLLQVPLCQLRYIQVTTSIDKQVVGLSVVVHYKPVKPPITLWLHSCVLCLVVYRDTKVHSSAL